MVKLLRFVYNCIAGLFASVIIYMPAPAGDTLRRFYFRRKLKHLGRGTTIGEGVQIMGAEHVSIGELCHIDKYVVISAGPPTKLERKMHYAENPAFKGEIGDVIIGNRSQLGCWVQLSGHGGIQIGEGAVITSGCKVFSISGYHKNLDDPNDKHLYRLAHTSAVEDQYTVYSPVVIQDGGSVGLNCVLLPGSTIGRDSWLAAGSVLNGELPPEVIAAGCPAKVLKKRRQ